MPFYASPGIFGPALRPGLSATRLHPVIPRMERSGGGGRLRTSFLTFSPSALPRIDPYPS